MATWFFNRARSNARASPKLSTLSSPRVIPAVLPFRLMRCSPRQRPAPSRGPPHHRDSHPGRPGRGQDRQFRGRYRHRRHDHQGRLGPHRHLRGHSHSRHFGRPRGSGPSGKEHRYLLRPNGPASKHPPPMASPRGRSAGRAAPRADPLGRPPRSSGTGPRADLRASMLVCYAEPFARTSFASSR